MGLPPPPRRTFNEPTIPSHGYGCMSLINHQVNSHSIHRFLVSRANALRWSKSGPKQLRLENKSTILDIHPEVPSLGASANLVYGILSDFLNCSSTRASKAGVSHPQSIHHPRSAETQSTSTSLGNHHDEPTARLPSRWPPHSLF